MKLKRKSAARVLAKALGLAFAALAIFVASCASLSLCGNSVLQKVRSPDGKYQAFVFRRDCGATTSYSTQVSVLPLGTLLSDDGGNIFISDEYSTSTNGVRVRWLSASRLKIICDVRVQHYKKMGSFNGISVVYAAR